ncbi:MAG: D-2-hydroxyacid dehydrogenase [Alysiella sp.]|uniref:D-2-hydroxyacid dehydrogenase n=1 Tax=Alysiella sp. TaxID=1872483 RepID=UPI0026DD69FF|nr:D-2-hydroxyacid dehydrogenase [Alysiella sp.]MDO4433533.1 D-2-hydroxyacid dehydrogenase [Alysiella sp.]
MNIVFLDRDTLPTRAFNFNFPHHYTEYGVTAPEETAERIAQADIILTNKVVIGEAELAAAPQLKMIAVCATGYNNIDLPAAKARGVTVCNVRAYGNDSVAEHALMLLLALMRGLPAYMRDVAGGFWQKSPHFAHFSAPLRTLNGKTLAIFGRGNVGQTFGRYAEALGMKVIWGEHKYATTVREGYTAFQAALQQADVVSLNCPLNAQTHHMIGEAELQMMKPQAILINVGRGGLADEQAVFAALKYGQLGGAGFDVLTQEPPREGNPLLSRLPNLIVTPHIAWAGDNALERMTEILEDNINLFVAGTPQNVL